MRQKYAVLADRLVKVQTIDRKNNIIAFYRQLMVSSRDIIFGSVLLAQAGEPMATMVNILGLWGVVYAFLQAIEAIFCFLGTRTDDKEVHGVELIHAICVLIADGFAFTLVIRPDGLPTSLGFVGLFLIGLGIAQGILTQRLQNHTV